MDIVKEANERAVQYRTFSYWNAERICKQVLQDFRSQKDVDRLVCVTDPVENEAHIYFKEKEKEE